MARIWPPGHVASVLRHPPRTDQVADDGLRARDVRGGQYVHGPVSTVRVASADRYDLALVAVRADQLKAACAQLTDLTGEAHRGLVWQNPSGRSTVGGGVTGDVRQRFLHRRCAARWRRRVCPHPAAAKRLAADPATLSLMCRGHRGVRRPAPGRPRRAAAQPGRAAQPAAEPVAVRYLARAMRSRTGELCFAVHRRHAELEMRALGDQVTTRLGDPPRISHLRQLLQAASPGTKVLDGRDSDPCSRCQASARIRQINVISPDQSVIG
jgi:hypothetical protein